MSSSIAIAARGLGKRYTLGKREQYRTLRDSLSSAITAPARWLTHLSEDESQVLWSLRDVSFDIAPGEVVGIIGRNGAGKSTLLKLLARITEPSEGEAEIRGRVGALLEVGTGFHPELTGRDNIFLSGAILGMRRREILARFDEIVAFAEVERFLDTPVKRFSSGMYVRLAFAVAAHLEPDILLIDEVLAVGDLSFQKKCLGKVGEIAGHGRTVFFVSHNMSAVSRLCGRALWLDQGRALKDGKTREVIESYLTTNTAQGGEARWDKGLSNLGVEEFKLRRLAVKSVAGRSAAIVSTEDAFDVEIEYTVEAPLVFARVGILLHTVGGVALFEAYDSDVEEYASRREKGRYVSRCRIPGGLLSPGAYVVSVNAGMPGLKNLCYVEGALNFDVEDTTSASSYMRTEREGVIRPRLAWTREER